jgi:hypothetical protein
MILKICIYSIFCDSLKNFHKVFFKKCFWWSLSLNTILWDFKCLSHRKPCKIPKNVTKLISVRKKSYTFSKYLMPSILKYIIHISYIFSFLLYFQKLFLVIIVFKHYTLRKQCNFLLLRYILTIIIRQK